MERTHKTKAGVSPSLYTNARDFVIDDIDRRGLKEDDIVQVVFDEMKLQTEVVTRMKSGETRGFTDQL